ncbi:MAG: hypothetical protein C4582_11280 [Desulfobacteraceae bacterium]|jgi:hypothetical protein|nr:MAG: hypothetical protein C4582_11280 [Desulfobacteraceae bacterium]
MASKASETLKLMMKNASADDWASYVEMGNKNFWTLQNHWMMNVEKKYGQASAVQFDGLCYGRAIEVAAYRLLKFFDFGGDELDTLAKVYQLSPAGSYIDIDFQRIDKNTLLRRVTNCPIQNARLAKGQEPIACKDPLTVAAGNVARVVNPNIQITRVLCPPDKMPEGLWCDVVYSLVS